MALQVLDVSIQAISALRGPVERLRTRDADLWKQIRSAASSVPLNIAEAEKRVGKDRSHHFRVAASSAEEVRTALRVATAWGDLSEAEIQEVLSLLDRVQAMLWRLTNST